jgi:hypothetical protein
VSDAEKVPHLVTNHQNQPVELYLPSGLVVLPPRGQAVASEADLAAPQLRVLRSRRLITTHEVAPAVKPAAAAEPPPARRKAAGGTLPKPEPDAGSKP